MESTIDVQRCPQRTPGIVSPEVPDGFIAYDPRTDRLMPSDSALAALAAIT